MLQAVIVGPLFRFRIVVSRVARVLDRSVVPLETVCETRDAILGLPGIFWIRPTLEISIPDE